ncbi:MAG: response regulator [Gammaproteobacteria bacterium]
MKSSPRILLVDDNPVTRRGVADELREGGYVSVEEAEDGRAAIVRLAARRFDLLITDWYMPGVHGIDLLRRVRGDSKLSRLPVILVGSSIRAELFIVAKAFGASACLAKPMTAGAMLRAVDDLLKGA